MPFRGHHIQLELLSSVAGHLPYPWRL